MHKDISFYEPFITDHKKKLIQEVLQYRTKYLTVALEDIYQSQNASAVLRTCDCFGIQEAHIIENQNKYTINPDVSQGSDKWITMVKHNQYNQNTYSCIQYLRSMGYRIVATVPEDYDFFLDQLPLDQKTAIFLGTEMQGLSDLLIKEADYKLKIPMYGFTRSFNISVSAAIILYHLSEKIRNSSLNWQLSEQEKQEITLKWYKKIANF